MYFSSQFINEVLSVTDLVEVIQLKGSNIALKRSGKYLTALCPFHEEKTASFTVVSERNFYYCFGCGASGNAINFLMNYTKCDFVSAVTELAKINNLALPTKNAANNYKQLQIGVSSQCALLLRLSARYFKYKLQQNINAQNYLQSRNISQKSWQIFNLGFANNSWHDLNNYFTSTQILQKLSLSSQQCLQILDKIGLISCKQQKQFDKFRNRIMFPIRDPMGKVIGFGGRTIGNDMPKYLNSADSILFKKRNTLYGLYEALQHKNIKRILVVEGFLDVISLADKGIHNVVASLGTSIMSQQINNLFKYTDEIVFCFDGDDAGLKAAWRAMIASLPFLQVNKIIRFALLPFDKDPDDIIRSKGVNYFHDFIDKSLLFSDFLLNEIGKKMALDTVEGRAFLLSEVKKICGQINDDILKFSLIEKINEKYKLKLTTLNSLLNIKSVNKSDNGIKDKVQEIYTTKFNNHDILNILVSYLIFSPSWVKYVTVEHKKDLEFLDNNIANILLKLISVIHQDTEGNLSMAVLIQYVKDENLRSFLAESMITKENFVEQKEQMYQDFRILLSKVSKLAKNKHVTILKNKIKQHGFSNLTVQEKDFLKNLTYRED